MAESGKPFTLDTHSHLVCDECKVNYSVLLEVVIMRVDPESQDLYKVKEHWCLECIKLWGD